MSSAARENIVASRITFGELKSELERGIYPIAFIRTKFSPDQPSQKHAIVVVAISEHGIQVLDPARGEITISIEEFLSEWNAMRRLTILIEK